MAGIFNLFLCPLVTGATINLNEEIGIDTYKDYWKNIEAQKITLAYLSPTMAQALVSFSKLGIKPSKRTVLPKFISTGSFLYDSTSKSFAKNFNRRLIKCYGVTEVGGSITILDKNSNKKNCVGKLSKGIGVIISENNEVLIKSNYMFDGYLNKSNKIVPFKKKYFNTGDLGKFINNYLFIFGRNKEIIKKGGEQVFLLKIEDVALSHKNIKDAVQYNKFIFLRLYVQITITNQK